MKELFFFLMDQSIDTRSKIDMVGIVADFYVDITPVIGRKVQAFDQYVSQGYEGQFARKVAEARDALDALDQLERKRERWLRNALASGRPIPRPREALRS